MSARIKASSNSAMVSASSFFLVRISPRPVLARPDFKRSKKVGGGGASPKVLIISNRCACQMLAMAAGDGDRQKSAISHVTDFHRGKAGRAADAAALRQHGMARSFHTVQPSLKYVFALFAQ